MGNSGAETTKRSALLVNFARIIALLAVIGLSFYIFTIRAQAPKFAVYGYPGIFIISILSNATILLPAPGIAFVFAMGSIFNPFFVGLVAGLGAAVGEISAYVAGFSGQGVVQNIRLYSRIAAWMEHYGWATILLLAAVPNPFFDLAGMAAGMLKMPIQKFFFWCAIGKIIKMLIFAYTGAYSLNWLLGVMK